MTKNTLWGIILDEQLYSEAPRAKFVHSSGERFAALIRSATWTERMVRVSDVARMARPNSGRAPTRAACSRVAAHIAPRDSPLRSPARRHGQSGRCASQAFPVDGAAKAPAVRPYARRVPASPLISRPAIRRFVPGRRRGRRASRLLQGRRIPKNRAPRSKKLLRPRAPRFFAAERGRYDKADNQPERTRHAA